MTLRELANWMAQNQVSSVPIVDRQDASRVLSVMSVDQVLEARLRDVDESINMSGAGYHANSCDQGRAHPWHQRRRRLMPDRIELLAPSAGWDEVRRWRKLVRNELLRRRASLSVDALRALSERACAQLLRAVNLEAYPVLALLADTRRIRCAGIARQHLASGGRVALPVMCKIRSRRILELASRDADAEGNMGYPNAKEREVLTPDAVLVPLVGFDECRFRLGYGGGYFDRTLAAAAVPPFAIGLGSRTLSCDVYPQAHDIA